MRDRRRWEAIAWWALLAVAVVARAADPAQPAQPADHTAATPALAHVGVQTLDFGMLLRVEGGSFKNVQGIVTVPADWPLEQRVRTVKQEAPPGATISYKTVDEVGRQMLVRIPSLPPGQTRVVVTFEIELLPSPAMPQDTARFTVPEPRKLSRKVAVHLAPSPKIESDHPRVRQAAQEAAPQGGRAWEKMAAVHQWVATKIAFAGGWENVQTCVQTLDVRQGVCAEKNSLAVAMLRALGIPARLVRIPGHVYYEFYLLDGEGQGHWFSADASHPSPIAPEGVREGVILQKGDNVSIISPTTKRRTNDRFQAETVTGVALGAGAQIHFQPITPAVPAKASDP